MIHRRIIRAAGGVNICDGILHHTVAVDGCCCAGDEVGLNVVHAHPALPGAAPICTAGINLLQNQNAVAFVIGTAGGIARSRAGTDIQTLGGHVAHQGVLPHLAVQVHIAQADPTLGGAAPAIVGFDDAYPVAAAVGADSVKTRAGGGADVQLGSGDDAHFGIGGDVILADFAAVQVRVLHNVRHVQLGDWHPAGYIVVPCGGVDPPGGRKGSGALDAQRIAGFQLGQHLGALAVGTVQPGGLRHGGDVFHRRGGFFLRFFLLIVHGGFQYPDKIAAGFGRCIRIGVFDCRPGQKERDGKQNCGQ